MFINGFLPTPITLRSIDISWLHCYVNIFLFSVLFFVFSCIFWLILNLYYFNVSGLCYNKTEILFIIIPVFLLLLQLFFSLQSLYRVSCFDTVPSLTLNITGHQWFWSYDFSDLDFIEFDSYILGSEDLFFGDSRLLTVDNRLVLPVNLNMRLCVTSSDVVHSWSLPSAGINVDAIPGVLTSVVIFFPLIGVFYGQCSEICGANHSFMPIVLEITSWDLFFNWALLF